MKGKTQGMIDRLVAFLELDLENVAFVVVGHSRAYAVGGLLPRVWRALDAKGIKPQRPRMNELVWKGVSICFFSDAEFDFDRYQCGRREEVRVLTDHAVGDLAMERIFPERLFVEMERESVLREGWLWA